MVLGLTAPPTLFYDLHSHHRTLNTNWEEKLSIQFGRQGGVTHQLGEEPKMRFVSTALVMMTIALMLLSSDAACTSCEIR